VALVCAGGGITGAVYQIGCLRALDEILDRSVLDLDLYVGISGGAFVASLLACGVTPAEAYAEVTGRPRTPLGVAAAPLFRLGLAEYARRSLRAPRVVSDAVLGLLTGKGRKLSDAALALFELLPPGLLDNSGIREIVAGVLAARGIPDRFTALPRELRIVAVDLDTGSAVTFGGKGRRQVPVSNAVQASTALPGLYRPVTIAGRDYVDGGVKKTAHINLAIAHGADLVICINPIVPILNRIRGPLPGGLARKGVTWVLDQALRIALHGRMQYGLERYRREHPEVEILLFEPTRHDTRMFEYNIMRLSARQIAAEEGYRSVVRAFRRRRRELEALLGRHGIGIQHLARVPAAPARPYGSTVARSLASSLDRLGTHLRRRRGA
jgi:predicted acylesterase/phospholipase RssA